MKRAIKGILTAASLALTVLAQAAFANGVTLSDLNIRSGPGVNYGRISSVAAHTPVHVVECLPGGWCLVQTHRVEGWAYGKYIRPTDAYPAPVQVYQHRMVRPQILHVTSRTPAYVVVQPRVYPVAGYAPYPQMRPVYGAGYPVGYAGGYPGGYVSYYTPW